MQHQPPTVSTRVIQVAVAIALLGSLLFFFAKQVSPQDSTIQSLNTQISRLKNSVITLSGSVKDLETRLGILEKELELERKQKMLD